jgi:CHAT domain-containing protein/Tfp pilus assembly protein PilF
VQAQTAPPLETALRGVAQGRLLLQRGAFEQAAVPLQQAVQLYASAKKPEAQGVALTLLAQVYQALGQYRQALQHLEDALKLAKQAGNREHIASILGTLGSVYLTTGPVHTASRYLHTSLDMARQSGHRLLTAKLLNNLGSLLILQQQPDKALSAYRESLALARATEAHLLAAKALTNAAAVTMQLGRHGEAKPLLDEALAQLQTLEPTHDKAYAMLSIGLAYGDLRGALPDLADMILHDAFKAFQGAADVALAIDDSRSSSYAWGYLGKLYENEHRYREALQLTRRAVFAGQAVNAPETLYRWQWQTGRLLAALEQPEAAILAYQQAVETVQSLNHEMSRGHGPALSFQEEVQPVYLGLVDLLLQRAAGMPQRAQYQPYLVRARDIVESFKVAELQDYFLDDCVSEASAKAIDLDFVSKTAVIVYPILLPDRTELLVSLPSGLERFTVPVGADVLTREVRVFRHTLENRTMWTFLTHAQTLYDWLIRPFAQVLSQFPIETLVFVPDGPLRTIPMAALHDGKQFLIRQYAVATTPGLKLTDPRPLQKKQAKILALGLTEAVQGFTPLPYVLTELQTLQNFYQSTLLINEDFRLANIEAALQRDHFSIVHVASHGKFGRDVKDTFLLTFGEKLTMDWLDQLLEDFRPSETPLELLTLSACETAAGDDRAALGLAGVAIKAGARSALATLWSVHDQASSELVIEFYRQLQDPAVSRALALQRAQLHLLDDPRYDHPSYWAPFLLLNNWL